MRFPKTILAAVAGAVVTAAPSFAQDVKVSPPVVSPRVAAAQTMMLSDLMRWDVVLQNGEAVGQISDFVIGPQGDVLFAVGTLNGQNYVMPFQAMTIDARAQAVQLAATPAQFDQLSFFRGRNFPDFTSPAFRQEMTQIYGDRIFNSGTSLRGRGNLGANQTEGRDNLNPAGKAPPGLNRDVDLQDQDPRIGGKKEIGDLPPGTGRTPADINEARKRQGLSPRGAEGSSPRGAGNTPANGKKEIGDLPPGTGLPRTPSGANSTSPRTSGNSGLPPNPSGTPNNPIPKTGKAPASTPAVPSGTPNTPLPKSGAGAGAIPPASPPATPPVPGNK